MLSKLLSLTGEQIDYMLTPSIHFFVGFVLYFGTKVSTSLGIIDDKLNDRKKYSKFNMYTGALGVSFFIGCAFDLYGGDVIIELFKWFLFSLSAIILGVVSGIRMTKNMTREDMLRYKINH